MYGLWPTGGNRGQHGLTEPANGLHHWRRWISYGHRCVWLVLARLQTPVIVVVMNDGALDLIRSAQTRTGKQVYGTEFVSPDFVGIATAYQIDAYKVSSEAEINEAIKAAVASSRPALIEAMIDPVSYPTTPQAIKYWLFGPATQLTIAGVTGIILLMVRFTSMQHRKLQQCCRQFNLSQILHVK